ncbi:VWA domain-containing protein [Paenibacillus nasutitermitis]|uniref:VWFA domain-containing protein n=1 Tax=Paenibacillus nasutitermitis TaxID=1652958 RepID=A0A917DM71_9BACL|nr:VWA domain-containing protein [Paenibacillus nasutitermitis]GGD48803.1 hypothetical protein GCM10010911_02900 [Paenibacillus nasutitermitis]
MRKVRGILRPGAVRLLGLAALLLLVPALGACSSSSDNGMQNAASSPDHSTESKEAAAGDRATESGSRSNGDETARVESETTGEADRPTGKREHNLEPEPQAGLLTAGEWNDLGRWNEWEELLDSSEGADNRKYWSFYSFKRLELTVTGGGRPVSDAEIAVIDKDDQSIWEVRTDINGRASVFNGIFEQQGGKSKYQVVVKAGGQTKRYENVDIRRSQSQTLEIKLDESVPVSNSLDLMLVVDTTGSMGDELNYLKTELKDVVERVAKDNGQQLGIRVSTNFYRDEGDDYVVKPFPFTGDVEKAVQQISGQRANGGGDFPEAVDQALDNAIHDHDWSEDARARLLFLVLDAPPHHDSTIVKRMQKLTQEAAGKGIRIIPVASSGVDVNTEYLMRFMAVSTGGTYIFLTNHSGVGDDHLEPAVGEYEVKALNRLLVEVINRYCGSGQSTGIE